MKALTPGSLSPGWWDEESLERLHRRLAEASRSARAAGAPRLLSVTAPIGSQEDPVAVVATSRRPGEPWYCFEQPDRDRFALAGLGCVVEIAAAGADRFSQVAARWRALVAAALADPVDAPGGCGLHALGGFAFAADGGQSRVWSAFEPASMIVPEISLGRRGERTWLTVNAAVAPDDIPDELAARVHQRLRELRTSPLPLLGPALTGNVDVRSVMAPSHYEEAVRGAVRRIRAGELEKIVLAREVAITAPLAHEPAAALGLLREAFPACFVFAVGRGEATFIAASPELLVRREGARASTVALAGSARRSSDPAVDDHLGEQLLRSDKNREENAIVVRSIVRELRPLSVWVTSAPEPMLVRVANIQHLAAPIRAQLASPIDAIELAGLLHPTPAVGAQPRELAQRLIPTLEGLDRGWYAGPVGWTDATGDGEFCVALRCALLRGRSAHLYAGAGVVRDSDPTEELAETEVKLQALLPVVAG